MYHVPATSRPANCHGHKLSATVAGMPATAAAPNVTPLIGCFVSSPRTRMAFTRGQAGRLGPGWMSRGPQVQSARADTGVTVDLDGTVVAVGAGRATVAGDTWGVLVAGGPVALLASSRGRSVGEPAPSRRSVGEQQARAY